MNKINQRTIYLVCKKLADDPSHAEHREVVKRHREQGLGWRYDGLGG